MKKLICLLLSILLAVSSAACSKKTTKEEAPADADTKAASSYSIHTIQKPKGIDIVDFVCYQKGGILRIGGSDIQGDNRSVWDSQDNGKSWECTVKPDAMPKAAAKEGMIYKYSAEGSVYVLDGTKIKIDGNTEKSVDIQKMGGVYLDSSLAANCLSVLEEENQTGAGTLWQYNVDTQKGKQIKNDSLSKYLRKAQRICCLASDASGKVLYIGGDGIVKYDTAKDKVSVLLDKKLIVQNIDSISDPISGMAVDEKKGIVLRTKNMHKGDDNLYLITKGAANTDKSKTIEVYSLKSNSMVLQSLAFFQKSHPDLQIKYTVGCTGDDGVSLDDAIRNLNTAILAGKGPDILMLDNLPVKQYIEKGALEDVSDIVNKEKDGLFYNIIKGSNPAGKIYAVPTAFRIPVIFGSSKVTSAGSTDALISQIEAERGGTPAIPETDFPVAAVNLFITSGLVGDELDPVALTKFYQNLEKLKKSSNVRPPAKAGGQSPKEAADILSYAVDDIGPEVYRGNGKAGISQISDDYLKLHSAAKQMNLTIEYLNKNSGNYYAPSQILGVNSKSKHKEAALDYLKMFLSEEIQNLGHAAGLSVNKNSTKKQFKITDSPQRCGAVYEHKESTNGMGIYTLSQDEYGEFEQFADKADTPVMNDEVVLGNVMEQAAKYLFEGEALKDAVNAACDKVNLYLKE